MQYFLGLTELEILGDMIVLVGVRMKVYEQNDQSSRLMMSQTVPKRNMSNNDRQRALLAIRSHSQIART